MGKWGSNRPFVALQPIRILALSAKPTLAALSTDVRDADKAAIDLNLRNDRFQSKAAIRARKAQWQRPGLKRVFVSGHFRVEVRCNLP